jgi:hypothetical protein
MKSPALRVLLTTLIGAIALTLGGVSLANASPNGTAQGRGIAMALMGGLVGGALGLCIGLTREAMRSK